MRSFKFGHRRYGNVLVLGAPYSYVYLLGSTLIDTGTGYWGKRILRFLREEGISVRRVLFTHSHYDHVGGYTYVREIGEHTTGAHPRFYEVMSKERVIRFIEEMNRKEMLLLKDGEAENYRFLPPAEGEVLEDGVRLGWEKGEIEVIHTPGHTRDSVSYYVLPERIMVVGEAAGVPNSAGTYILPQFLTSVIDYLNSLRRLREYDVELLGLPHVMLIEGKREVRRYLSLSEAATRRYVEDLKRIYEGCGGEWECIKERVMEEIYRKNSLDQPEYAFLANLKAQIRALERDFYSL